MVEENFLKISKIFQRPCSKPPTDFIHNFNVRRIFLFERFELPGRMHDAIEAKFAPMTSESMEGFESTSVWFIVPSIWTVASTAQRAHPHQHQAERYYSFTRISTSAPKEDVIRVG